MANKTRNRVSNQEVASEPKIGTKPANKGDVHIGTHEKFPEIDKYRGAFKIKVKVEETDDDGKVTGEKVLYSRGYADNEDKAADYSKDGEPYEYFQVPSIHSAIRYFGGLLDESQIKFIDEALTGKETGKAVKEILDIVNGTLDSTASRNQYQRVLSDKTPLTDESRDNAMASSVRSFAKTTGLTPEQAIGMLKTLNPSPLTADYTLAKFLQNKGKR